MKKIAIFIGFCCIFFTHFALSANKTIICEPPFGTRIDYFSFNNLNLKSQTFLMGKDQVAGMQPQIILSDDHKVTFIIGDPSQTLPKSGNMQVLIYNEEQITFAGVINNAPILATYYPKLAILIYSQQSIWPGPDFKGARAVILYSKCK